MINSVSILGALEPVRFFAPCRRDALGEESALLQNEPNLGNKQGLDFPSKPEGAGGALRAPHRLH